jgi:hypothetical protein
MEQYGVEDALNRVPEDLRHIARYWASKPTVGQEDLTDIERERVEAFNAALRMWCDRVPVTEVEARARANDKRIQRADEGRFQV